MLRAQTVLKANGGNEDAYQHINQVLGGAACEVPDCIHPVKHITEEYDTQLKEYVFVFHIHTAIDNDRCKSFDRQRNEIKTYGPSVRNLKGQLGDTYVYQWKFKLDSSFKAQPTFTHIHQIKAGDGDAGAPIITLTPRYGSPDRMEVIHTGSSKQTSKGVLKAVNLADFKGQWVEVTEKLKYDSHGTYEIEIRRISDGKSLLSFSVTDIDLWRSETSFCRPKWGIYRSLKSPSYIQDENIKFADISIKRSE
ncbi:MAG: heparin lyase I family protein [Mucilaginibacter sp.]|uniref:heparin lyase I family protein n=1 Tax=Mucilaginibacter sp. TaxID=1882438 RepID=UPI003263A65E